MKTIKEIADQLGVDKQKVYRFIKSNCINEAHQEHITKYYDEAAQSLILRHFSNQSASSEVLHEALQSTSFDAVIESKNMQIEQLTKLLEEEKTRNAELTNKILELSTQLLELTQNSQRILENEQKLKAMKKGFFQRIKERLTE